MTRDTHVGFSLLCVFTADFHIIWTLPCNYSLHLDLRSLEELLLSFHIGEYLLKLLLKEAKITSAEPVHALDHFFNHYKPLHYRQEKSFLELCSKYVSFLVAGFGFLLSLSGVFFCLMLSVTQVSQPELKQAKQGDSE